MGGEPETFELNIRKAYLDDTGELVVEVDDV